MGFSQLGVELQRLAECAGCFRTNLGRRSPDKNVLEADIGFRQADVSWSKGRVFTDAIFELCNALLNLSPSSPGCK
jgi:hypothetical protein